jgi:transcriptional regulator with XRE-family HTH domain
MLPPVDENHQGTRPLTKLETWRLEQGYTYKRLAESLGVTTETARRYCLPRGDRLARTPAPAVLQRMDRLTNGQVAAADYGVA